MTLHVPFFQLSVHIWPTNIISSNIIKENLNINKNKIIINNIYL